MQTKAERKTDYRGVLTNTDAWDTFSLRSDDVIVNTPPKCGTTWILNVTMMLIHGKVMPNAGSVVHVPWLDTALGDASERLRFLDGLDRRRCIKSHTPMDGLLYAKEPTYLVVYRHPIDMHFSFRTHSESISADILQFMFPDDERAGFQRFVTAPATDMGCDDLTLASLARHYDEARAREKNGNVHFFHYADLTRDLRGQIDRLCRILGTDLPADTRDAIAEANTFAAMRKVAEEAGKSGSAAKSLFARPEDFFASGTSNKWEGRLTAEDLNGYSERLADLFSPDDRDWIEWGGVGQPAAS